MNYQDQQVFFSPQHYILLIYLHHQKEMIAQHPAGPSVVLFKGKSFQMPIQRSRVKVPVLLLLQMLEVAYFRRFWPIKNKNIITKSLILLGTERLNCCILDLLGIMEYSRKWQWMVCLGWLKKGAEQQKHNTCVPLSVQNFSLDTTGLALCFSA